MAAPIRPQQPPDPASFEASDVTGVTEFAPPCVDAVLTLGDVYADTDIVPPPPDLTDLDGAGS